MYHRRTMVDKRTTTKLEEKLTQELATLEVELADIGHENYMNPSDWHGTNGDLETGTADATILADRFEAKTTNEGIVSELEARHGNIKDALEPVRRIRGNVGPVGGSGALMQIVVFLNQLFEL